MRRVIAPAIASMVLLAGLVSTSAAGAQVPEPATITVDVLARGIPMEGVGVDLFRQLGDGRRGDWLLSAVTDVNGRAYPEALAGQCYVITGIAPDGYDFGAEGRWANRSICPNGPNPPAITLELQPVGPTEFSIVPLVDRASNPVYGVDVDLFTMTADGSRGMYLRSTTTGADRFAVPAGCYVLTFVAPPNAVFEPDGSRWHTTGSCVTDSDVEVRATLASEGFTTISGSVTEANQVVGGVQVDLFTADGHGNRIEWRSTLTTEADGRAIFTLDPGCWALTFVAPAGQSFVETGTGFITRSRCVRADQNVSVQPVALVSRQLTIGGSVRFLDGRSAVDAAVDLFEATADGSRGRWLAQTTTNSSGQYRLETPRNCVVLTFIAPEGSQFTANRARWWNRLICPQDNQASVDRSATLETAGHPDLTVEAPLGSRHELANWTFWEGGINQPPPLLSGDGTTVVFTIGRFSTDRGLRARDVDTGAEVVIVDGSYQVNPIDVSDDGRAVLFRHRTTVADDLRLRWWTGDTMVEVPADLGDPINLAGDGSAVVGLAVDRQTGTTEARFLTADGQVRATHLPDGTGGGYGHLFSDDNRYLVRGRSGEESPSYLDRIEIATGAVTTITGSYYPIELAADGDLVRLDRKVGWIRFSTGVPTVVDHGANEGWFTYRPDYDMSDDGSTFLYPRVDWPASVYRVGTGEVRRLPLQGDEDLAAMSDDGTRFLVGEPLTDSTYRLVVLSMPPEG